MKTTTWSFHYGFTAVKDMHIAGTRQGAGGKSTVTGLELAGERVQPTRRFWKSFFNRFGVSDNVFRYFEPAEVFQRISARSADDLVRYCVERNDEGQSRLLAVSSPKRPVIDYDQVTSLIRRYDGQDVDYEGGIITSTHAPRSGDRTFSIGGDQFQHRFVMELGEQCDLQRDDLLRSLYRTTGNLNEIYGLANLDALSIKRQRILPARCRVYDLINFASETATHHATPAGNRAMQAFIGSLISDEYDMEGTAEAVGDFNDFFMESPTGPSPSVN